MNLFRQMAAFLGVLFVFFSIIAFQNCENNLSSPLRLPSSEKDSQTEQTQTTNTTQSVPNPTGSSLKEEAPQLQIPKRAGIMTSDCQQNSQYNACIYKKNPILQKASPLNLNAEREDILRQLTLLQTYSIRVKDTTDGHLKNNHFDVTVKLKSEEQNRLSKTNPNDKWTTPYSHFDFSVEQVMAYHYLMYQRDWMILNTNTWYASDKKIAIEVSDGPKFCAYWSPMQNKVALCGVSSALSAEIILHEAGHAHFYHSSPHRINSVNEICTAHVRCSDRKSLCELSKKELDNSSRCCISQKGCFSAINEGQADFHAAILFPNNPQIGELIINKTEGITGCFPDEGGPSRDPRRHKSSTADQIYNSCQSRFGGKGEIHVMGIIYNSIWWEIYNHTDTFKKDIVNLFTEHLPLITYGDTFETAGNRIINLAKQMFGSEPGSKGLKYANVIREEFIRANISL